MVINLSHLNKIKMYLHKIFLLLNKQHRNIPLMLSWLYLLFPFHFDSSDLFPLSNCISKFHNFPYECQLRMCFWPFTHWTSENRNIHLKCEWRETPWKFLSIVSYFVNCKYQIDWFYAGWYWRDWKQNVSLCFFF